jgi:hypothetical protein
LNANARHLREALLLAAAAALAGFVGLGQAGTDDVLRFIDAPDSPLRVDDAWSAVIDDFNGDGHLDIAVLCPLYYALFTEYVDGGTDAVTVLLGIGDGTFAGASVFPVGDGSWNAYAMSSGDFDGDSHVDLLVASPGRDYRDPNVYVLSGNGDGGFQSTPSRAYRVGREPAGIFVADFDLDGRLDIAAACIWDNCVSIRYGEGGGRFSRERRLRFSTDAQPSAVVADDFNADGWLDLAVTQLLADRVTVFLGGEGRRFEKAGEYTVGNRPMALLAADVSGDERIDLVVTGLTAVVSLEPQIFRTTLSLLLGDGLDAFAPPLDLVIDGKDPIALIAADVNGDGLLDLATANEGSNDVSLLIGAGDGAFTGALLPIIPDYPAYKRLGVRWIGAGDFDEDGRVDLAILAGSREALFIWLNAEEE